MHPADGAIAGTVVGLVPFTMHRAIIPVSVILTLFLCLGIFVPTLMGMMCIVVAGTMMYFVVVLLVVMLHMVMLIFVMRSVVVLLLVMMNAIVH